MSIQNNRYSQQRRFEYPDDDDETPDSVKEHRNIIRSKTEFPGVSSQPSSFSTRSRRNSANANLRRNYLHNLNPSIDDSDDVSEDVAFAAEDEDNDASFDECNDDFCCDENVSEQDSSYGTRSKQSKDIYEKQADAAIAAGDLETGIKALLLSFSEKNNLNSAKRVGEILSVAVIQEWHNTGYDGGDWGVDAMVQIAIGMFLTYVMLGGAKQDVKEYMENLAAIFNDPEQFATIFLRVKSKLSDPEAINSLIKEFYNR